MSVTVSVSAGAVHSSVQRSTTSRTATWGRCSLVVRCSASELHRPSPSSGERTSDSTVHWGMG
jgi:hypothetical protein